MAIFDNVATVDDDNNFAPPVVKALVESEANLTVISDEVAKQLSGQAVYPT